MEPRSSQATTFLQKKPDEAFAVSNYDTALKQSKSNYKKMLDSEGGREAVKTMIDRGREDNHFRILTKDEATLAMSLPHHYVLRPL